MTPLTTNPSVNVLRDAVTGRILRVATNVAPNLTVTETVSPNIFLGEAANKPFNYDPVDVVPEPTFSANFLSN